jgi:hypothetical protein
MDDNSGYNMLDDEELADPEFHTVVHRHELFAFDWVAVRHVPVGKFLVAVSLVDNSHLLFRSLDYSLALSRDSRPLSSRALQQ